MPKTTLYLIGTLLAAMPFATALSQPVIPGAVGFGMGTPAGRGGDIIPVTNLNGSGPGSLEACVKASGPRICVFEVSGTIRLSSNLSIENPYLTIAGQTAPAPGIMIRGAGLAIRASHVLIQHIAVRTGDHPDGPLMRSRDSLKILGTDGPARNIVIDHCSFSWAIDEILEVWGSQWNNVTLSNNIFSEPLRNAPEDAGTDQGYGALIDATSGRIAFVGNLFAHAHNRNPRSAAEDFVFVNNVVYNAGVTQLNLFNKDGLRSRNSIVGNVFIKGRNTDAPKPILLNGTGVNGIQTAVLSGTMIFLDDNAADEATSDPWSIVRNDSDVSLSSLRASTAPVWPSDLSAAATDEDNVLNFVLQQAGSRPEERSEVDRRIIEDVRNGTGHIINCVADDGSSRCARNAGGWPQLAANTRRLTIPENPHADDDGDGYTNVEEWLHGMAAQVEGRSGWGNPAPEPPHASPPNPPRLTDNRLP